LQKRHIFAAFLIVSAQRGHDMVSSTGAATGSARLPNVARIPPQHPLQLLGREPASEPPPRVFLGSLDERLTEALVETGTAVVIGSDNTRFGFTHDDEGSAIASQSR
jgi:hypothetical protein